MSVRLTSILLSLMTAAPWAGEPVSQSIPAPPDGLLLIQNVGGSVLIQGWDREEIEVTGELDSNAERIDLATGEG